MMEETGTFEEYLNRIGEVNVEWIWCEGDDWDLSGEFDLVVTQGDIEVTNDLTKAEYNYLLQCTKEHTDYEPDTKRAARVYSSLLNNNF
jgi:hypothetical protein